MTRKTKIKTTNLSQLEKKRQNFTLPSTQDDLDGVQMAFERGVVKRSSSVIVPFVQVLLTSVLEDCKYGMLSRMMVPSTQGNLMVAHFSLKKVKKSFGHSKLLLNSFFTILFL